MIPQEYVKARSVSLDALDGLGAHRDAVVLVGAQAVYLHAGDADFVTAPTTTDAADAESGFGDPDEIKMSMVALVDDLLRELDRATPGRAGRTRSPAN
ncbi:hypothetical protein B0I31_107279 [Saccharothrix carnea]|uniref:Uncharacterized protein n=1 Tax=Saccharothrix carnea TaxID=1280637 RepID=A0A2P8I6W6_SACCR|nr:hypothetical protein [Saccharothrix carnea]PSL54222.1 hypothetical protein B0I31_107279 [Saccharothrix carnea]